MIDLLLLHFADALVSLGTRLPLTEGSSRLGFVVIGIIVIPVLILTVASIIEFPKKSKVPELFLGGFVVLVGGMAGSLAVIGFLLKFIVPQS